MCEETIFSQGIIVANILQCIQLFDEDVALLNASSSEVFSCINMPINENTSLKSTNPYGCAQTLGHQLVDVYREFQGVKCANVILFPHESIRRNPYFLFRKIIQSSVRISRGLQDSLAIGNIHVVRDWGCAEEYMNAIVLMIDLSYCSDICICTSSTMSVKEILEIAFSNLGLNWRDHVKVSDSLIRYNEDLVSFGDNSLARKDLQWAPIRRRHLLVDHVQDQEIKILE
jgi:GDPmannose 4,6-dehydratase